MIPQISLVISSVRSAHNVGSILRTADAAGVTKVFLCGETPAPIDRFGRARADIAKVALGAEKTVEWEYVKDIHEIISKLKKENFKIFALEQSASAIDYRKARFGKKNVLIVGNEVRGIEREILEECDQILEIPMKGNKESLNVAVATGVALFGLI